MNTSVDRETLCHAPHPARWSAETMAEQRVRFSVIVPVFNEEEVLPVTYQRLQAVMAELGAPYEIIFVNDGSADSSMTLIESFNAADHRVKALHFSRNFGHQIAISAGMEFASGDAVIIIDADLQDPPELIPQMVERWMQGYEVVYAKRISRQGETRFKRFTATAFYRTLRLLTEVDIPVDVGDFRLIDRKVCDVMKELQEKSRFVRGLVAWMGFRQAAVDYVREPRFAGETKYPVRKMLRLSADAITSFSEKPLKLAMVVGGGLAMVSFLAIVAILGMNIFAQSTFSDLLILSLIGFFFDGLVLITIGILGQYVARVHDDSRGRPLYVLDRQVGFERESTHDD